ncbi:tetratricopeptide repeat protein [Methanosarcina sp. WH1]|uniref:tetratricopeptide repeat protein n=1 Tax=Methanosarcina sp. WH1 TaxID=1434102 RepID=UPI00061590C2|nr:tetratricopeptide repeat protein [Methanosarcina sp. WH1]AKB22669.1 TPR-domain containing protein [Methanosarcina sp. WH1]
MHSLYARAWYSKALALLNLKNPIESEKYFEKALEAFDALLEINPEDTVAWQYKGKILRYMDRPEESLEAFEKVLVFDPDNVPAHYFKGMTLGYLNLPEQALEAFEEVFERDAKHAGALYYSGLALYRLGRHIEAVSALSGALKINPDNPGAWYHRGASLYILGKSVEALEAFEKALALEPLNAGAWEGKAKAYLSLRRKREALNACEKALELEPASAGAWKTGGKILESIGKREEALEAFERSLTLEPTNVRNRVEKGRLLGSLGRYEEALQVFESALQMDSSLTEAKINRGKALLALGNYQQALDSFSNTLKEDPKNSECWGETGRCFLVLGKYYDAMQAYEKALSFGSENSCTLSGIGEVYYELGNYSEALEAFEQAIRLDLENAFAWNGKGNVLCKLGKYREALEAYENLLTLDYESLPARYNRGVALSRLKTRQNDAEEPLENQLQTAFKKYLELSGNLPENKIGAASWKYRGIALAELGEYKEALKAFDRAAKYRPEDISPLTCRGIVLICLGKYEKALEVFEQAEESFYTNISSEKAREISEVIKVEMPRVLDTAGKKHMLEMLMIAKGFALEALGRYEDALKAFESARKLSGNGKIAFSGKGIVFVHCGEWKKALEAFDSALIFDPGDTLASAMKAFALIRLKEFEEAVKVLERVTAGDTCPDLPFYLLGFACSKQGDFENALQAYRKATEANPKNIHARNGLAEIYFRLGNSRGALKELEASIAEAPENAFSRNLKGRVELEEQACEDALESFRMALALDTEDKRLLLWDVYARYMYAETSFEEDSARFRYILLAAAGKLEKAAICREPEDNELKAYALYFLGFFYYKARYFRKASERLEECLKLENSREVKQPAALFLKNIRTGHPGSAWWEWWFASETYGFIKKAGFGLIFLIIFSLLLSHPAASTLPFVSWPASIISQVFYPNGENSALWARYGKEYVVSILILSALLFLPAFRFNRSGREELELETLTPPPLDFDIPSSILEEFKERLEKNLFSPEPMRESMEKLGKF